MLYGGEGFGVVCTLSMSRASKQALRVVGGGFGGSGGL